MKKIIIVIMIIVSSVFASSTFNYNSKTPLDGKSLLVTLTSDSNLKLGMAMHLSMSALKKGANVIIFAGADVIPFLKKNDAPNTVFLASQAKNKKISDVFKLFIKNGGKIFVCNKCTKYFSLKQTNMIDGANIVHSKKYFDLLFYQTDKHIEF